MDTMTPVDEMLFGWHSMIERFGWMVMYVLGDPNHPPWGYTIGLSRRYSHPELVVVGLPDCCAGEVLDGLVRRVDEGERLDQLPAALQVHWTDDDGHFPGHPDFDRSLRRRTRRLNRAPRARKRR